MPTPKKELAFPLSKCMDTVDILTLEQEHRTIVSYGALEGQHEARWWEYSMAHYVISHWASAQPEDWRDPMQLCDVGGGGSKFAQSLVALTSEDIMLVDPAAPLGTGPDSGRVVPYPVTVEQLAGTHRHGQLDCITAISVIEHLEAVRPFIRACHMLLKPGGLLFLTTDCWNKEGQDVAHFHWMRKRIYNPETMGRLAMSCREIGFRTFGRTNWDYHTDTVYDYTFASLAQVKR